MLSRLRSCLRPAHPEEIFECRRCGAAVDHPNDECPHCGTSDITTLVV